MLKEVKTHLKIRARAAATAMALLCLATSPAAGLEMNVDVNSAIYETQKSSRAIDEILTVWWIPPELMLLFLSSVPNLDEAQRTEFLESLDSYMVFLVIDGKIGPNQQPEIKDKKIVRKSIRLMDIKRKTYKPLKEKEISLEAKKSLVKIFPVLAGSYGPLGRAMHYVIFDAKGENNMKIGDVFLDGWFEIKMETRSFRWRTPLSTFVPPKYCPVTGEELPGGWKYNPWNGAKLD